jgi:hypothetical protein
LQQRSENAQITGDFDALFRNNRALPEFFRRYQISAGFPL